MTALRRPFWAILALLLVLAALPGAVLADENDPPVIEPDVFVTIDIPESLSPYSLIVQAMSWTGTSYQYILTLTNLSPWPMKYLYVLDRYFPDDPEQEEILHEWFPEPIEPGRAASYVISFPDGPLLGGCHQLEISLADGLGFVLMDCSQPNATSFWNVPLGQEMEAYLAEPVLTVPEPEGNSRLGLHVTRNASPKIMDFVREAHPALIVAVGDLGWLADVKEVSPNTITVGRLIEGDQSFEGDPAERAREFVNDHLLRYLINRGVDYWLGWNEPVIDEIWQMEWYAAFEAERVVAMAELGLKAAIGNFSAGTPEADEFEAFLPAMRVAKEHGSILAVHEYSAPTLREGVGAGIPGLEAQGSYFGEQGIFGALTLRYRYWYEHYLRPNDLVLPLVVTEAGIDGGVLRSQDVRLLGWRDFSKDDLPEPLVSQTSDAYVEQLSWYDDQLRCDPYVLGFAVFNAGDSDGRWASFDVTEMLPQLAGLVKSKG